MKTTELRIHLWPEPILRSACRPVVEVDNEIRQLLREMVCLMQQHQGIGLAANQAGLDLSLVVIEVAGEVLKLVNPRILKSKGSMKFVEGCLSFPGLELKLRRARQVWVEACDDWGKPKRLMAEGLLAVVLQHEIDHIKGISFIDRVPFWQRLKLQPKLKKLKEATRDGLPNQEKES